MTSQQLEFCTNSCLQSFHLCFSKYNLILPKNSHKKLIKKITILSIKTPPCRAGLAGEEKIAGHQSSGGGCVGPGSGGSTPPPAPSPSPAPASHQEQPRGHRGRGRRQDEDLHQPPGPGGRGAGGGGDGGQQQRRHPGQSSCLNIRASNKG